MVPHTSMVDGALAQGGPPVVCGGVCGAVGSPGSGVLGAVGVDAVEPAGHGHCVCRRFYGAERVLPVSVNKG